MAHREYTFLYKKKTNKLNKKLIIALHFLILTTCCKKQNVIELRKKKFYRQCFQDKNSTIKLNRLILLIVLGNTI